MGMGDVMQDLGLEYYNPNHNPQHSHQHSQYMNGVGGVNGAGGLNGLGASGMVGMNGMNGGMSHGNGGMLPPPPPHLSMDQVYKDPHSQQQYMMDSHHGYHHQQDYGQPQVPALPMHGPGNHEEIWMNFMQQLTTPDGQSHHNGYQPQMGHHG